MEKPVVLVSSCLLGNHCRYNGKGELHPKVAELSRRAVLIPFCPEIYGGLSTPRDPAERKEGRVMTAAGVDVTMQYEKGAKEALFTARQTGCCCAVLKERSPSCGRGMIYDGTYTRTLIPGNGVTAELFEKEKIPVYGESEWAQCMEFLDQLQKNQSSEK